MLLAAATTFLAIALALAALLLFLAWRYQERIVWQPPAGADPRLRAHPAVRRIDYAAEDGQPLLG